MMPHLGSSTRKTHILGDRSVESSPSPGLVKEALLGEITCEQFLKVKALVR